MMIQEYYPEYNSAALSLGAEMNSPVAKLTLLHISRVTINKMHIVIPKCSD